MRQPTPDAAGATDRRQSHAHDGLYEWRMSFEGHLAHLGTDSSTGGLPAI